MASVLNSPLDRLLDPVADCLTTDVAQRLIELRADPDTQSRIDELAARANEGTLTLLESEEYQGYVEAIDIVSILQAKARKVLTVRGA